MRMTRILIGGLALTALLLGQAALAQNQIQQSVTPPGQATPSPALPRQAVQPPSAAAQAQPQTSPAQARPAPSPAQSPAPVRQAIQAPASPAQAAPTPAASPSPAQAQPVSQPVSQSGARTTQISVVFAPRNQAVLSAEVTGVVKEVSREFGQTFEPGTPLIRLDPTVYKANYAQAAAALEAARTASAAAETLYKDKTVLKKAQAVLSAAKADYEAKEKLYSGHSTSLRELEASRRELNVAEANREISQLTSLPEYEEARKNLAQAQARFKIAETEMEGCQILAPYKGRVEKLLVNVNELVERGRPLIQVIDDEVLRAKFLAPSVAVQTVRPGMNVVIEVNELGKRVTGRVSHVSAVLDPASGTFEVYAEVDNPTGSLRSGMTGQVDPASLKN